MQRQRIVHERDLVAVLACDDAVPGLVPVVHDRLLLVAPRDGVVDFDRAIGCDVQPFSSAACTLGAFAEFKSQGKKINVAYVFDTERGIKLFADQAFYAVATTGDKTDIAPFLLKKDAEAYAAKTGGKVVGFDDALKVKIKTAAN